MVGSHTTQIVTRKGVTELIAENILKEGLTTRSKCAESAYLLMRNSYEIHAKLYSPALDNGFLQSIVS